MDKKADDRTVYKLVERTQRRLQSACHKRRYTYNGMLYAIHT